MTKWKMVATSLGLALSSGVAQAGDIFETFENNPTKRWAYFADTVMGGVSAGNATIYRDDTGAFMQLKGEVRTDNNGGFIQARHALSERLSNNTTGVRLRVRGNGETYFVHLRTTGTRLPWQYYRAQFETSATWSDVQLPLTAFKASGQFLQSPPRPESITSIAIVAIGRPHTALIDVGEVDWY